MIDYKYLYKAPMALDSDWSQHRWDYFISAFTKSDRVLEVYNKVTESSKHWLVFPEYKFSSTELPTTDSFISNLTNEAEYIDSFWTKEKFGDVSTKSFCIDTTGFIRPYLLFLVKWLQEHGVNRFDALYSEPKRYQDRGNTSFSGKIISEVRQVAGFEGNHDPDTSNDCLIIGAGYDHNLIAEVAKEKAQSSKYQIFGFPSLHPDMYQENILNAFKVKDATSWDPEDKSMSYFSPANDPFITASTLRNIVSDIKLSKKYTNLYLSPLSTKPQVLGFALYFLTECRDTNVSMIFPFSDEYNQETSEGLSRVWKYTVELPKLLRN